MAKTKTAQEKEWEAEDAARTLIRAEEIKADKGLFLRAHKELIQQEKAIQKVVSKAQSKKK